MAKKKLDASPDTREVIQADPSKLREIAALIHECADAYEQQAKRMEDHKIDQIAYSGFPTIRDKVVKYARGNASGVASAVQEAIAARLPKKTNKNKAFLQPAYPRRSSRKRQSKMRLSKQKPR